MNKKELILNEQNETLVSNFISYMKRKNMAANTIEAYEFSLRLYFGLYDNVTPGNLKLFRSVLMQKFQPATVNQRIHAVNHFLLFLETYHNQEFPDLTHFRLKALKLPRNSFQDTIISNEDCLKLQACLKQEKQDFWYFIVRFLVTTGVRVSELTQIKVEHLSCGYLDLYSKGGKIRRIYITDALSKEALEWCHSQGKNSGFLFASKSGLPITVRGIQYQLKHFALQYDLNPATVYPHSFRHRFAKNFLQRCGDIALLADLLGHESIETTRIYLTSSSSEQQLILDEIVTW
ncbi:MAG: tyrosine-type recombinase/integrase [Lachnospiraceae bacterium]|nr:tyrosine-type recombinase/integrase [Lachnospiraceae bacterium]